MSRPRYRRNREYAPSADEVAFVLLGTALAVELALSLLLVALLLRWW